ncbi:serine hydrolase domain-containing protein [Streptomyces sp. enrichment culture]|uniref:serine hydrolase domain-containing protein n=1 Tax=Streptomyces sp. enrichment culture TaxID=1795815 RepID=UPI003F54A3D0
MPRRPAPAAAASLVALCLSLLSPAPATAAGHPEPSPADAGLQRRLEALVRTPGGPPGVIAVLRDEHRARVVRAGVADLETGRPPQPHDHMRIASTAKAFSGAVALSLVRLGDLRLGHTIGTWLPQLPKAWHKVTLRQLLNHTSGLPDYSRSERFVAILRADPRHRFDSRRLLDFAGRRLLFPPGSRYQYSNSDNIAVALMAEAATGERYERLLEELVYRPLGLHRTSLPQGFRMREPYLHGYDLSPADPPEDVSELIGMSGVWASGGIVSTPADMTRFVRGYASGRLYGPDLVRAQRRWIAGGASEPAGPGRNDAGLALFRYTTRCGVVLGHTGNTAGYTQLIAATPDGRRSLTFSTTSQINQTQAPELLRRLRAVQEDFVCALLKGRP